MAGRSAGVVTQPGVKEGERTYCPISGVVFEVSNASPRREVGGKPVYFCCESCARYFSDHAEHVAAVRGFSSPN